MDQQGHGQSQVTGVPGSSAQMPYSMAPYQPHQMMRPSASTSVGSIQAPQSAGLPTSPAQLAAAPTRLSANPSAAATATAATTSWFLGKPVPRH